MTNPLSDFEIREFKKTIINNLLSPLHIHVNGMDDLDWNKVLKRYSKVCLIFEGVVQDD